MSKFDQLKKGEMLSFTTYVKVDSINKSANAINVTASNGAKLTVAGRDLIESFNSNSQFEEVQKLGKNALAEKLQNAGDKIFTVEFTKATGEDRVLTGHFVSGEPLLGRSTVRDLAITSGNNLRQVDHRTIKSIIVGGVKYTAGTETRTAKTNTATTANNNNAPKAKKASGRMPAWANTPAKRDYVIDCRAKGTDYSQAAWKEYKKSK